MSYAHIKQFREYINITIRMKMPNNFILTTVLPERVVKITFLLGPKYIYFKKSHPIQIWGK